MSCLNELRPLRPLFLSSLNHRRSFGIQKSSPDCYLDHRKIIVNSESSRSRKISTIQISRYDLSIELFLSLPPILKSCKIIMRRFHWLSWFTLTVALLVSAILVVPGVQVREYHAHPVTQCRVFRLGACSLLVQTHYFFIGFHHVSHEFRLVITRHVSGAYSSVHPRILH